MSKILALDYEGTSKEPRRGWGCQLGVAIMDGPEVLAQDEWLIKCPRHYKTGKPMRECDAFSLGISGLTLERIEAEGVTAYESCERLKAFVLDNDAKHLPVVAYNFTYDAEAYGQMLFDGGHYDFEERQYFGYPEILGPKWICAYRWARRALEGRLTEWKLDDVAAHFGLARETESHEACADAILAGKVFHALAEASKVAA